MFFALLTFLLEIPNLVLEYYLILYSKLCGNSLNNKVVLLTGASSGIGKCLARQLHSQGCKLILASRNLAELDTLKSELTDANPALPSPIIIKLDLNGSDEEICATAEEALKCHGGKIDVLVNNSGLSHRSGFAETNLEDNRRIMDVNYFGPVALSKALLPSMTNTGGQIVNIGSVQSFAAMPNRYAYSASKHAIKAFSDSLRAEVADVGIAVTFISLGYVNTQLSENAISSFGARYGVKDANISGGYCPDYVARLVSMAIAARMKEVTICPLHHSFVAYYMRYMCPLLYFKLMEVLARKNIKAKEHKSFL